MKTFTAPLKSMWLRKEFLDSQNAIATYEGKKTSTQIFCSHCKKEITGNVINVVAFGKMVACNTCNSAKWRRKRNIKMEFQVPDKYQPEKGKALDFLGETPGLATPSRETEDI